MNSQIKCNTFSTSISRALILSAGALILALSFIPDASAGSNSPERIKSDSRVGFPLPDFVEKNFIGSSKCALCHSSLVDSSGADMSIPDHWRSTMMANAARDPLWQAKVKSEVSRNPHLAEIIEKKCVSCHMPMAYRQMNTFGAEYPAAKDAGVFDHFNTPASQLHQAAMDGVSCSLCHQIVDKGLGTPDTFSGKFKIDTETPAPDRKIYGPYKEPFRQAMRTAVGFDPTYGPQTNDSSLCATCHTLYTPYVDADGKVAGEFPEQTVYLEWLNSKYGEQPGERHEIGEQAGEVRICQECHMPHSVSGGVMIANPAPKEALSKDHFSQHHFVGGNVFMLNILMDNMQKLKITSPTAKLQDTRTRTLNLLKTATGSISIQELKHSGNELTAIVSINSFVGHKFPSGFPSRRAWVHLHVTDASGGTVFESGRPLENGGIEGNDADSDGAFFEPHYDLITSSDQVQIYEAIMHDTDNRLTYTLLRGAGYLKDNRLLPSGFDLKKASPDIAIYGNAASDGNFTGGADTVTYTIQINQGTGPYSVTARLLYSPVSLAFMKDLQKDDNIPTVALFSKMFARADKMPVIVAEAETSVP